MAEEDTKVTETQETKDEVMADATEEKTEEKVEEKAEGDEETKEEEKEEEVKEEEDKATKKEAEKPKEQELDAPEDSRPKVDPASVEVNTNDATLNSLPTAENKILMTMTDGGLQNFLSGIRSTTGIKSGRYMFEVKIVETLGGHGNSGDRKNPKNLLRIGLSVEGSSVLVGDGTVDNFCYDTEGFFIFGKTKKKISARIYRENTLAMLVNLDPSSPVANTISLFKNGHRICSPQAIPEQLLGKTLFPTITYKCMSVQVNFGPTPLMKLPFTCRMLADAASEDVEMSAAAKARTSTCEVVFPIGLPDTGYFDWVDQFLADNPHYVEVSDRKIIEWAVKSGVWRPKGPGSLDKPDMKFGFGGQEDETAVRLIKQLASVSKRNLVIPELKANLIQGDRAKALNHFSASHFNTRACVFFGEPSSSFKEKLMEKLLSAKKAKAAEEKKKEDAKKKAAEEAKKKAALKKGAKKEGEEKDEEMKDAEEEKKEEEEPVIELTEEEKALKCTPSQIADISEATLGKSYASFSLPGKDEGFGKIEYVWKSEEEAEKILKDWIFGKKLIQRVDDLAVGEGFKEAYSAWRKQLGEWKKLANEWKDPEKRKAMLAKRKEAKKKEAEEKGDEAKEEEEEAPADVEEIDVFAVSDVTDIGGGRPLFADFAYEDWALLQIRYELHLLLTNFKKDLNDPDRPGFAEKDLAFYYNKYFKTQFSLKNYNLEKLSALQDLIRETFTIAEKTTFLEAAQPEDTPMSQFVKMTEDHRRERQRRLDAGDETAELSFPKTSHGKSGGKWDSGKGGSKGKGKGKDSKGKGKASLSSGKSKGGDRTLSSSGYGGRESYGSKGGNNYSSGAPQKRSYPSGGYSSGSVGGGNSSKFARSSYSSGGGGGGNYYGNNRY